MIFIPDLTARLPQKSVLVDHMDHQSARVTARISECQKPYLTSEGTSNC
jgi:hypothetical protein